MEVEIGVFIRLGHQMCVNLSNVLKKESKKVSRMTPKKKKVIEEGENIRRS